MFQHGFLTTLLGLSAAAFLATPAQAGGPVWGQFYANSDCTGDKKGLAFSIDDGGCLDRLGNSIKFHTDLGSTGRHYGLVVSPDGDCPCQSFCKVVNAITDISDGDCWELNGDLNGASYRWISLPGSGKPKCPANNC